MPGADRKKLPHDRIHRTGVGLLAAPACDSLAIVDQTLTVEEVSVEGRAIRVNRSVQRLSTGAEQGRKSELRATETKTDGSRRTIALPDSVVRALRMHRARQAQARLAAGTSWRDQDLVFANKSGQPIEPIMLHRDYKALLKKSRAAADLKVSRPPTQRCIAAPSTGRSSAGDYGIARALINHGHYERLRPRDAGDDA
jgi:hypothetical protein